MAYEEIRPLWFILDGIILLYAVFLFIYGKFFRHKDSILLVRLIFILLLQKNYPEDNKGIFRTEDSIRVPINKDNDDSKRVKLIE